MGYRATLYVCLQTIAVLLLGFLWLAMIGINFHILVVNDTAEVIFGFVLGFAFYTYITVKELRSLDKTGGAKISGASWIYLAFVTVAFFSFVYFFIAASAFEAVILFINAVIAFVLAGGLSRTLLLYKWEREHDKVIIASFYWELYAISK